MRWNISKKLILTLFIWTAVYVSFLWSPCSLETEHEAESVDCKETIKFEIKHEIQETEDMQNPVSFIDNVATDTDYPLL